MCGFAFIETDLFLGHWVTITMLIDDLSASKTITQTLQTNVTFFGMNPKR